MSTYTSIGYVYPMSFLTPNTKYFMGVVIVLAQAIQEYIIPVTIYISSFGHHCQVYKPECLKASGLLYPKGKWKSISMDIIDY